ncbi:uncharacterized protein [Haliotis asinina]|uniref:uncharacterized protein n=1 Tax=Haliotis asinina TaxID=109174 RepID=UPI003531BB42
MPACLTPVMLSLDPRDAFFGGRTNATKLYYQAKEEEDIIYMNVCSLYPYICKYGTYHVQDKLLFTLCCTCAEQEFAGSCPHGDEDQARVGTYVSKELQYTVQDCGYQVLHIFEAWHFNSLTTYDPDTQEGGLFAKYVNNIFKIKQEASGYPEGCTDPDAYIREIQQKESVTFDRAHICKNPGLRALAKACLNNHWGKFGQCVGFDKAEYISSAERYFALLRDERCLMKDIHVVNEDLIRVTYEHQPEFHNPHPAHNVVIAAWVTAQARLKLYSYLKPLDRRILYFDMDSIIYIHSPLCYNPPLGDTLGELTDELGGINSNQIFVSEGPKNYGYKLRQPQPDGTTAVSKVRGYTLKHRASQCVHFDSMKKLVCQRDEVTITVPYPRRIIRTGLCQNNTLLSKDTRKVYRMVYTKRRVIYDSEGMPVETLPYG